MRFATRLVCVFGLAALLAVPSLAQEPKKAQKKPQNPNATVFTFPKQIKLDDQQTTKLAELKKEFMPQLEEIQAKLSKVMTPERNKAQAEARKAATDAGKKGKDLQAAILEALKLNADEEATYKTQTQARAKLVREINQKKTELLTEEQKALLKPKK